MNERRYVRSLVVLTALQVLPLGLLVPVYVLVMQARGLSGAEIGVVVAVAAVTTAVLELPTGGLADAIGRRKVLLAGAVATLGSLTAFALAGGTTGFLLAGVLFAVGKALESGPLESWFVDAVNDVHAPGAARDEMITKGLGRASSAMGIAAALGAVSGGALAELGSRAGLAVEGRSPVIALSVPLLVAAGLVVAHAVGLMLLMDRHPHAVGSPASVLAGIGPAIAQTARLVSADRVLCLFGVRWLLIPTGFLAFELITPIRLSELLGDPTRAALLLGPLVAGCFLVSGATAALAPAIRRSIGPLTGAGSATAAAGLAFVLAGQGGAALLAVGLLAAHVVIGPVNALNGPFLHARVTSQRRATLLSFESLVANISVAVGAIVLGLVSSRHGTPAAFALAGLLTATAALPLIGVARHLAQEPGLAVPAEVAAQQLHSDSRS